MKNFKIFAFLSILSLIILSCDKKDEQKEPLDVELPDISFTGFSVNDTLHSTVKAEIKGSDSKGLKSLEIFVNDSLLATNPGPAFTAEWNTLKSPDGDYTIKMVATDISGNKKEVKAKVVVSNALITVGKNVLVSGFWDTADYYITDSAGNILANSSFKINQNVASKVHIYSKNEYSKKTINLIRVHKSSNRNPTIEYYIGIKRGEVLEYVNPGVQYEFPEWVGPVPVTLMNVPAYNNITISTTAGGSVNYPLPFGATAQTSYNAKNKAFVQIENADKASYNFFDIAPGSKDLKFDLSKVTTTSLLKKVTLPSGIKDAYVLAYVYPKAEFAENYVMANKKFSGSSVNIFYPDTLKSPIEGIVQYTRNGFDYMHFFYTEIPNNVTVTDFAFKLKKAQLGNFDADMTGQFDHYRILFENKAYTSPSDQSYVEILVFGSPGNERFSFPDLKTDFGIPGFDMNSFKPTQAQFYKYDGKSALKYMFNSFSTLVDVPNTNSATLWSISLR
jgi:hypothetical protein